MKKFKKPLSLVLVLTMISSMFSVIDFSLFASAEDSVTTVTYTEDFQNETSAKENWEIKNLLEGSVTQDEGYASKFKFVTPRQESKSLQPLYYVYNKDTDEYTERSASVQDSFNATAFMFKSDVAPDNFSKKTITGSLKMYLGTCNGGGQFTNIYNRLVIGYDDNGNPVSVTIGREGDDLKVVPLTYVKASDGKIYNSANNDSTMWPDHLAGIFSFKPGQAQANGYWGPTINYEIVITPNADGKHYDTEVTFTNPSATALNESNDTTYTDSITATSEGKIATVSSFGINVLPDEDKNDDNKSAYDNIKIVYEVPKKTYESVTKTYTDDFSSPDTTKTKWTIKNLSESVSQAEGYKADFFFATPKNASQALQANYAAYNSETSTYSQVDNIQKSFNATAFIFNEDVVPAYFSKKTITGKAKLHDSNLSGSATPNNNANRFLIGYDASGNAITPAFGKDGKTVTAAPNTKLNLSTAEITGNASPEATNKLSFYPTRDDSTGYWGPYIEFKIEITSNLSGTYDATITISNPTAQKYNETNETDTYVSTRTYIISTKLATVSQFGIFANRRKSTNRNNFNQNAAYDDISVSYEIDPVLNFLNEKTKEFGDGSQFTTVAELEEFVGKYESDKALLSEDALAALNDSKLLNLIEARKLELQGDEIYTNFRTNYADIISGTAEDVENGDITLEYLTNCLNDYWVLSDEYRAALNDEGVYKKILTLRISALKKNTLVNEDFDDEAATGASDALKYAEGYNGKKAAYFDDSAKAYVDFGNVALGENSFAVSYWFKTDVVLTTEGTIFANDSGITVTNTSVSKTTVNAKIGENEAVTLSDIQSVGDTRWHNVIISVNRGEKLSVYVDGKLAYDVSDTKSHKVYETDISTLAGSLGTGKFVLGANTAYESGLAKASVDEFKIYSDFVTADEALSMYNCEKLGAKINEIENKMATYKEGTRFTQSAIDGMNTELGTAKAVVAEADCSNADTVSAAYDTLKSAFESFLVGKEAIKTVQLASDTHIYKTDNFVYNGSTTTEEEKFQKLLTETKNGELGFNVDTYLNAGDLSETSGTIAMKQAFAYYENYLPDNTLVVQAMGNHDSDYGNGGDTSGLYNEAGFIDNVKNYVDESLEYNKPLLGEDGKISTAYYYSTDGDIHYIVLTTALGLIEDAELNWLKCVMKEIVKDGKPIFIVDHCAPDYYDYNQFAPRTKEVIEVIDYSQVYYFYGHNHLSFGNKTAYTGYSTYAKNATFFNLPTAGKADSSKGYENSAYYYLFYYEDQMVLRARDSMTNEWITEFDIELDIDLGAQILKSGNSIIADIANDTLSVNSTNADTVKANANAALTAYNNADADTQAEVDSLMGIDVDDKLTYTVKYADVVKAVVKPSLLGTQLKKVTDVNAVDFRYAIEYIAGTESSDYSIAGYGAVVVPNQVRTDKAADITTSVKVEEGKEDYISNVYVTADTVKVDSNNRYYVAVTGSKGKLGTLFDCRPYIIYKDSEGTEYIVYAENEKSSTDGTNVTNGQASTCCLFVTKTLAQRMVNTLGESCVFTDMGESYDTLAEMQTAIDKIGQKGDSKPTTDDRAAYFKFIYLNNSAYEAAKGDTNNENV